MLVSFSFFVPEGGIKVAGISINYPTLNDLLNPKKQEKANIDSIVNAVDTVIVVDDSKDVVKIDTKIDNATILHLNESAKADLHRFFEKLGSARMNGEKVHILHYGDSQIEGDRMTNFIRERLQSQFGGYGSGLVPAINIYPTNTFVQSSSSNFYRYTCFGGDKLPSRKYGAMASAAKFGFVTDSLGNRYSSRAWIDIQANGNAYTRAKQYHVVKMFYNSCNRNCVVNVYENGALYKSDSLITDGGQHTLEVDFGRTPGRVRFEFLSGESPVICGFSMEGDVGVQMSNIGMRGTDGGIFGSMDLNSASRMMADLETELVIMQFGGNAMPMLRDSAKVRSFANFFSNQIQTVQKMRPNAAIIVIGPSDMSRLKNGIRETYPMLPYTVQQMKKKSLENGVAYWDLFGAMGGKNSMPTWVDKGLAGNDYIHFSTKGATVAAQLFYDAFLAEYAKWSASAQ